MREDLKARAAESRWLDCSEPRRPYLLSVYAGPGGRWLEGLNLAPRRSWDLHIHQWGPSAPMTGLAEHLSLGGLCKFPDLAALHRQDPVFGRYKAVLFQDDDVRWVDEDGPDRLFRLMTERRLDIAQPALTADSGSTWEICRAVPGSLYRLTNFVEVMCPAFSRHALERCMPSFDRTVSGWGLDYLWAKRAAMSDWPIGIVDSVQANHPALSAPSGQGIYRYFRELGVDPHRELLELAEVEQLRLRNQRTCATFWREDA